MFKLKKEERPQSSNLVFHFRAQEKEEQTKLKASRRKDIRKIIVKINETEQKYKRKSLKSKASFLKMSINKLLATLIKIKTVHSNH